MAALRRRILPEGAALSYVASFIRGGSARSGVAALSAYVSCLGCVRVLRWRGVWLYWMLVVRCFIYKAGRKPFSLLDLCQLSVHLVFFS